MLTAFNFSESPSLVTVLILVSKMTATAAFDIIYLVTSEISPTLVRNTSLGVSSVCARVAGTVMPYVMLIGKYDTTYEQFLSEDANFPSNKTTDYIYLKTRKSFVATTSVP